MSTIAAHQNTTDTHRTLRTGGRFRRMLVGVLLAFGMSVGTVATVAAPANAASYVEGCFRNGTPGMSVQSLPVQLQAYHQGTWYTIGRLTLPLHGCVAWNVNTANQGYYLRMLVNHTANGARWYGSSPYYANPGTGRWSTGTGTVYCSGYGCTGYY